MAAEANDKDKSFAKENPWVKFFFDDWLDDQDLQVCSFAAKGLWMDLLALMRRGRPYGYLQDRRGIWSHERIANRLERPLEEITALMAELEANGVFSVDEAGVPFSRRMVRDYKKTLQLSEWGTKGANKKNQPTPKPDGLSQEASASRPKPIRARASDSDSGSDSESKSEKEKDKPQFPSKPPGWDKPDCDELARGLIEEIHPIHPEPCDRQAAIEACRQELLKAVDPEATTRAMRSTYRDHQAELVARRMRNPDAYIWPLHHWFSKGYYAQKLFATATRGSPGPRKGDDLRAELEELRKKAS